MIDLFEKAVKLHTAQRRQLIICLPKCTKTLNTPLMSHMLTLGIADLPAEF